MILRFWAGEGRLTDSGNSSNSFDVLYSLCGLDLDCCDESLVGGSHVPWTGKTVSDRREERALTSKTERREFGVCDY